MSNWNLTLKSGVLSENKPCLCLFFYAVSWTTRVMQINNIGMIWASAYVSTAGTEMKRRDKVGGRNNDH